MTVLRRFTLFVVVASLLAPAAGAQAPARGDRRPNVLIIFTDDQRSDTMTVMPQVQKWFEQKGTKYPNAYVGTPLCCPSRGTIMTGRYAHNHGVVDNGAHHNLDQRTTLQHLLGRAGYRTAIVGKYFNGWPLRQDPPHFDRFAIFRTGYHNTKFSVDGKVQTIGRYSTDYIAKQSIRYLRSFEKRDKAPWLMYVAPSAPHDPFTPAARHAAAPVSSWEPSPAVGEEDRSDKPPAVHAQNAVREHGEDLRTAQLRTLLAVDEMVGRVMAALGKLRERRNTLVFFFSDNGFYWAEHGVTDKRFPYTEAVSVPFYARWPGRIQPGGSDPRLVSLVDLAPTVLAATGTPPHPTLPLDGRSLLDTWDRDHVYIEYFPDKTVTSIGPWASVRTRTAQYSEYYSADGVTTDFREYYDLERDPHQLSNLLGDEDPGNDPSPAELQPLMVQLANNRSCQGTIGTNPCP